MATSGSVAKSTRKSGTGNLRSIYHTGSKAENAGVATITPLNTVVKQAFNDEPLLGRTEPSSALDVSAILDSVFNNISSVLAQQASAYQQPQTPSYYVYENNGPSYEELQSLLGNLNFDLNLPDNYLQSAFDLAQYNTDQSQAMAREQMAYQTEANAKAMEFNKNEAQKTRDWVQAMSDTSHQREVTDLVAAGLNPILSANQGASTGTAANAIGSAGSGAKGTVDTQAVSVLMNAYKTAKEIELQEKGLSLQEKMNLLNNETNRYMADKSAAASIYNAGLTSSAARYSSEISAAANRYASELNYQSYSEGLHNNLAGLMQYVDNKVDQIIGTKPSEAIGSAITKLLEGRQAGIDRQVQSGRTYYEK